jgi:hypothetical protein
MASAMTWPDAFFWSVFMVCGTYLAVKFVKYVLDERWF